MSTSVPATTCGDKAKRTLSVADAQPTGDPVSGPPRPPLTVPMFSVCIVVRDRPEFLINAVRSVLANSYRDFEIVIVDDGSALSVAEVIGETEFAMDRRLKVVIQPPLGIAQARNVALRVSAGRYITVLDSDDELSPDALHRIHQLLRSTGCDWVYADYREATGRHSKIIRLPEYATPGGMLLGTMLRPRVPFKHSGTTVNRQLLVGIGGYDERFSIYEDVELTLRALCVGIQPRHLRHPIVLFRRHDGNVTSRRRLPALAYWFRLIDMYKPRTWWLFFGLPIKLVRVISEVGKWLVALGR